LSISESNYLKPNANQIRATEIIIIRKAIDNANQQQQIIIVNHLVLALLFVKVAVPLPGDRKESFGQNSGQLPPVTTCLITQKERHHIKYHIQEHNL